MKITKVGGGLNWALYIQDGTTRAVKVTWGMDGPAAIARPGHCTPTRDFEPSGADSLSWWGYGGWDEFQKWMDKAVRELLEGDDI